MKSTDKLIDEFLANGGKIEVIPPIEVSNNTRDVGSSVKKKTTLMSLEEAELMYGQKIIKEKKLKETNDINEDLIPDHLKHLLKPKLGKTTKEDT